MGEEVAAAAASIWWKMFLGSCCCCCCCGCCSSAKDEFACAFPGVVFSSLSFLYFSSQLCTSSLSSEADSTGCSTSSVDRWGLS